MDVPTLHAETRTQTGTKNIRRLREQGRMPGVIYGHGEPPVSVSVSTHDVMLELQHGARVVELKIDGKVDQYLIKEIQYDHLDKDPLHIDFARVDMNEKVQVKVGIELRGTPEGIHEGGILDQIMDSIEIECLASQIPDTLHPSVTHLKVGDALTVGDLELPEGVTALDDADEKIAMVSMLTVKEEAEEVEEEGAEGPAEPERIGRVADDADDNKGESKD